MSKRVGGIIFVKVDGKQYRAKGSWSYNLGAPKREAVVGSDSVHGYKEMPQVGFIEGVITDSSEISMTDLVNLVNVSVILELANGKVISLKEGFFAGDGNASTEEGEIEARFESADVQEVR